MVKQVSIAKARQDLAALVRELDKKPVIELTRRGKSVAVLLSMREYNRLRSAPTNYWKAYTAFRERVNLAELEIDPKIWEGLRDRSTGREAEV